MKKKYLCVLLLTAFVCSKAFTQPFIKAQRTAGSNESDEFTCMWRTFDGGLIAGGYSSANKYGDKTEDSRGLDDFWVVKYDIHGNIQWDKTIGGNDIDRLYAIQQTSDSGFILGGFSSSGISGAKTGASKGADDYWLVKTDSKGNIEWDKTIGGNSSDELFALQQTRDGGYILGGTSWSNKSGDKTEDWRGWSDYWLVKTDKLGNIQWDKTYGGNGEDNFKTLQQTGDGGYILGGNSQSGVSGEKTGSLKGIYDYWVLKLNSNGYVEWDKTLGAWFSYSFLSCLTESREGGFLIGGRSDGNISYDKTENSRGWWDYWIVKLNNKGKIEWDKTIGGAANEDLSAILQTIDGGYILAGNSSSNISGEKSENSRGLDDYWIVKLNKNAHAEWDKTMGGYKTDVPAGIIEVISNRYVVGGYSKSARAGDKKTIPIGQGDFWFVYLVDTTGKAATALTSTNENNLSKLNASQPLTIYPNPAKEVVTIKYTSKKSGTAIVKIADINGKIILYRSVGALQGQNQHNLNISHLVKGVYFVHIIKPGKARESIQLEVE